MPIRFSRFFAILLAVCFSALASAAHAGPFVVNKAGDEVLDISTGWVWKRCSLGQTWNGQTCVGTPQVFNFDGVATMARTHAGWVVPRVAQLISLRVCSTGESSNEVVSVPSQGGGTFKFKCNGRNWPTINASVFPETPGELFWTSSPDVRRKEDAWCVSFRGGSILDNCVSRSNGKRHVRLVRSGDFLGAESALAFELGRPLPKQADFAPEVWAQSAVLEQSLGSLTLPWEPKSTGNPLVQRSNAPNVDIQKMAFYMKALALSDINHAPVMGVISPPKLTEPVREAFQHRATSLLTKGEFETTAAYEARKQEAKENAEPAYQSALKAFNAEQLAFKQQLAKQKAENASARAQAEARIADPQAYRSALLKAWELMISARLGDPVLQNIAYDADRQVFTAKLLSSHGVLMGDVVAPVPLAQAPSVKTDLLSGKIAPKVSFDYPSMRLDWALIENSAQRSARFAAAQNSVDGLEALIREFPNAPEVSAAKQRVQALISARFAAAQNSVDGLEALIREFPNAPEVSASKQRLPVLRFAAAQNSIDGLGALISEFPNAPEVSAAKQRVKALIAQEFSNANTSSILQSVLNQYPTAAEAPAARKRVEQLRLAEQRAEREAQEAARRAEREAREAARRAEREAQEAARRQREWENSPQGQAQRQQRQMCEVQKKTCFASCPAYNHSRGASNDTHFNCERQCGAISCY